MSIVTGFNVTMSDVELLAQASIAAFAGGEIPDGWNVVTPAELGVSSAFWDGIYFTNEGASAIVLQQDNDYVVAFRGTDGINDIFHYTELFFGTYINLFQPLLSALANFTPSGTEYLFTGASLGGGATNLMANIAGSQYGGEYASAKFVAFASPNITDSSGILNIGAENDPVYKALDGYSDSSSTLDNFVLATPEYMDGNYDGRHPFDVYAHDQSDLALDALDRVNTSRFSDVMLPDSVVIIDAAPGTVQDLMPGREATGAFYLGEAVGDTISGQSGGDYIEGFDGADLLFGNVGDDFLSGGLGDDWLDGGTDRDFLGGESENDVVVGGDGDDNLRGGTGDDFLNGGPGTDRLQGNTGFDTFKFDANLGFDHIVDFTPGEDLIDLSGLGLQFADLVFSPSGDGILVGTPEGTIMVQHANAPLNDSNFVF